MSVDIQLVGQGSASRDVHRALQSAGLRSSTTTGRMVVFTSWESVHELSRSIDGARAPCLIVEALGRGVVAFGPSFHRDTAGCFHCYIARRRANGGTECRPASRVGDATG